MKRFDHQGKHLLSLLFLLIPMVWYSTRSALFSGGWLGVDTQSWYWFAIAIPIFHQFGTMLGWRLELHGGALTLIFGERAFAVFKAFFFPGLIARPLSVLGLSLADRGSLAAARPLLTLAAYLMVPILFYLFYSIVRYFGIQRAAGADHFIKEYRNKPIVVEGIYRYIPNAMYAVGFFVIWIPALLLASRAGLLVAAFQHVFIWAHYAFTERPDMEVIYGPQGVEG